VTSDFRSAAALQFALALCKADTYIDNKVLSKSWHDYLADDAVDLADALISRLAVQPEHGTSPNIIPFQLPKA
jgi:hypothetical protein